LEVTLLLRQSAAHLAAIVLSAAISAAAFASEPAPPSYRLTGSIPLGPGERWDYVTFDPSSNRAFVAHGDHVTVVDTVKARVVGKIGTFPGGTHGIGISTANGHGYTDDGKAGMVGVFDLVTLKAVKQLSAAPDADGIIFDPASGHFFVIDGDSGTITVIDPEKNAAIATITVGASLEAGAADGAGRLYIDGVENHDMIEIVTCRPGPSARCRARERSRSIPATAVFSCLPPKSPGPIRQPLPARGHTLYSCPVL
jgi:YVTN family beta-propeller protein